MSIDEYLRRQGITQSEFARQVGVYPSTIHHLRAGTKLPSAETLARIVDTTRGAIGLQDFVGR